MNYRESTPVVLALRFKKALTTFYCSTLYVHGRVHSTRVLSLCVLALYVLALSVGTGTGNTSTTKIIVDIYLKLGYSIYPNGLFGIAARCLLDKN